MTVFFLQEAILSGLYLWFSRKFLRTHIHQLDDFRDNNKRAVKSTLRALIITNIIVILLDIAVLALQYHGLYILQLSGKNFVYNVYNVKLKIQLGVLS